MATVVIVGASGFVGSNLVLELGKQHKVIAMFRKQIMRYPHTTHFTYTFEDKDYLKRIMQIVRPDAIIYVAGIHDFMECHKKQQLADAVNALGPMVFSSAAESLPHRFIYVSCSYVFDGRKGSYEEDDVVAAETTLGKTKLSGENYVRTKCQSYTILRASQMYGLGSYMHPSFFDKMRMALSKGQKFELPENEYQSFLYMGVLAKVIDWILKNETINDTYHISGLTKVSTFDFGKDLATSFGLDTNLLVPTKGAFPDSNFLDFSLNGSKMIKLSGINPLTLEEGIESYRHQFIKGNS